jgi:hypothetical protein
MAYGEYASVPARQYLVECNRATSLPWKRRVGAVNFDVRSQALAIPQNPSSIRLARVANTYKL